MYHIMRKSFCFGILVNMLAGCSSDDLVNQPVESTPIEDSNNAVEWNYIEYMSLSSSESNTVDGINDFSYALIKEIAETSGADGFSLSPISVAIYLSMLANATSGDAHTQILKVLKAPDITTLNSTCEKFMRYLPYDRNGSSISVSNRFWIADSYSVPEAFRSVMAAHYNAVVESVDFGSSSTVPTINHWVS